MNNTNLTDISGAGKGMESIDETNGICSNIDIERKYSRKKDENFRLKMVKNFQDEMIEKSNEYELSYSHQNTEKINFVLDEDRLRKNSLEAISGKSSFNDTESYNRILYHTKPYNNPHKLKRKMPTKLRSIKDSEGHPHQQQRRSIVLTNIGKESNMKLKAIQVGRKSILSSEIPIDKIYNFYEKPVMTFSEKITEGEREQ